MSRDITDSGHDLCFKKPRYFGQFMLSLYNHESVVLCYMCYHYFTPYIELKVSGITW